MPRNSPDDIVADMGEEFVIAGWRAGEGTENGEDL